MEQLKYDFNFREKYLAGDLGKDVIENYEKALEENPALLAELQRHIHFTDWIGKALTSELAVKGSDRMEGNRSFRPQVFMWAALILILVIGALTWIIYKPGNSVNSIYQEYYSQYPGSMQVNSLRQAQQTQQNTDSILLAAFHYYENKEFGKAKASFSTFISTSGDSTGTVLFFLAMTEMGQKSYKDANTHLEKYLNTYSKYKSEALWYSGLSSLAVDDRDKAVFRFNQLLVENGIYSEEAREILQKL